MRQLLNEIVVTEDGTTVQTSHVGIAVNNDAAARSEGQLPMPSVEGLERLELVEGYTLKPDGRHTAVQPGAVHIQSAPGMPNLPEYTDREQIVAIMPEVAGGDVLVANWRPTTQPLFATEFVTTSMFPQNVPWDHVELTIRIPADKPFHVEAHGPILEQAREGDLNVYR